MQKKNSYLQEKLAKNSKSPKELWKCLGVNTK